MNQLIAIVTLAAFVALTTTPAFAQDPPAPPAPTVRVDAPVTVTVRPSVLRPTIRVDAPVINLPALAPVINLPEINPTIVVQPAPIERFKIEREWWFWTIVGVAATGIGFGIAAGAGAFDGPTTTSVHFGR